MRGRRTAAALAAALMAAAGAASVAPAQPQQEQQEQEQQGPPGDPRAGRRLAGGQCAACHGNDGIAVLPEAPNLAGQKANYVAAQLQHYRSGERQHELMTVVAQGLSDQQIADLAAWYASIEIEATVPGRR